MTETHHLLIHYFVVADIFRLGCILLTNELEKEERLSANSNISVTLSDRGSSRQSATSN